MQDLPYVNELYWQENEKSISHQEPRFETEACGNWEIAYFIHAFASFLPFYVSVVSLSAEIAQNHLTYLKK